MIHTIGKNMKICKEYVITQIVNLYAERCEIEAARIDLVFNNLQ